MPPKPKYTRAEIVSAALSVVSEAGVDALTAKSLAKALHTSTTPIFTVFTSMQEVIDATKEAAMARFEEYAHTTDPDTPPFKQIGMQMLRFALDEPQLYRLIFMAEHTSNASFDDIYMHLGPVADESLDAIQHTYNLSLSDAKTLFEHTWIHTFGIGALCATGMCHFTQEQISHMLTQDFTAMMTLLKSQSGK